MIAIFIGIIWLSCGGYALWLDRRDYPEPVVPVADALLAAVLFLGGPASLVALALTRTKGLRP